MPVGPAAGRSARRTASAAPTAGGCPVWPLTLVAVCPGHIAFALPPMSCSSFATYAQQPFYKVLTLCCHPRHSTAACMQARCYTSTCEIQAGFCSAYCDVHCWCAPVPELAYLHGHHVERCLRRVVAQVLEVRRGPLRVQVLGQRAQGARHADHTRRTRPSQHTGQGFPRRRTWSAA